MQNDLIALRSKWVSRLDRHDQRAHHSVWDRGYITAAEMFIEDLDAIIASQKEKPAEASKSNG